MYIASPVSFNLSRLALIRQATAHHVAASPIMYYQPFVWVAMYTIVKCRRMCSVCLMNRDSITLLDFAFIRNSIQRYISESLLDYTRYYTNYVIFHTLIFQVRKGRTSRSFQSVLPNEPSVDPHPSDQRRVACSFIHRRRRR